MYSLYEVYQHIKAEHPESLVDDSCPSTKIFEFVSKKVSAEDENQVDEDYDESKISCNNDDDLVAGGIKLKSGFPNVPNDNSTIARVNNELSASIEERTPLSSSSSDKKYGCDICNRELKYKCLLKNHKMIHSGTKPFSCDKCEKTFLRKHDLLRHAKTHSRRKSLHCKLCRRKFAWKKDLKAHGCSRASRVIFTCDLCTLTFVRKDYFKDHVTTQCGTKPLHCDVCGNKYLSSLYLERHKLSHIYRNTFYRLYGCCSWESELNLWKSYPSAIYTYLLENSVIKVEELDVVEKEISSEVENTAIKMEELGDEVENPIIKLEELEEHIGNDTLSNVEISTVKLEDMDDVMESDISSAINIGGSSEETILSRGAIGRENDTYLFKVNNRTDGERARSCNVCHKTFKYKSLLDIHSATHTNSKQYSCGTCQKKFLRKAYLHRHNCRSRKEPLSCDVCSLTFVRRDSFNDHVLTECGTKPLCCDMCGMKYVSTLYLERHKLTHIAAK